ncbi:MAG: hypothetical protein HRU20_27525, partial [Pseudomonadales bacterium]|nr:hypothetical protein [Pseudomonadales bacterium]
MTTQHSKFYNGHIHYTIMEDVMFLIRKKIPNNVALGISLILASSHFITACDTSSEEGGLQDPIEIGLTTNLQANIEADEQQTFIGSTLFDTGKKVVLVAGDLVTIDSATLQTHLKPSEVFTFYGAYHDEDVDQQLLNFSIQREPVIAREDRWYPADVAYVNPQDSKYTGLK